MNDLGFVEAIDRLSQRIVVRVADAAYGRFDPGFSETLGVLDRNLLGSAITVMNKAAAAGRPSVMKRLFEGVQDEVGVRCPAGSPADDPPGVGVDDESDIDEACPSRDIGKIGEPQTVRRGSVELSVHMIQRTGSCLVADCGAHRLAPDRPTDARPCARRRRGSSLRTRAGSRPSDPRRDGPSRADGKDQAAWTW